MYIINFFIIPIILVSLFYRNIPFSYVISSVCSLAAATFIYARQDLANIVSTIAVFNITPLVCAHLNIIFGRRRASLGQGKASQQQGYQQMLKARSIVRQSSAQLNKDVSQVVELYKMGRDMSAVLKIEEIFDILGKKLVQNFHFRHSRLVLLEEEPGGFNIKKVLQLEYSRAHAHQVEKTAEDREIAKEAMRAQKLRLITDKALTVFPLLADNKFLGALAVEDLPPEAMDNFSILANHFCLEFKRIRLYQRLQKLAISDGLTGLFVRRYFLERLAEEVGRSMRHHLKLAFLMLDIDHFKQCNDRFGHLTGDVVLREVAGQIKACVREIDLVGRYGGEEFSVLLPDTDRLGAGFVAERIRSSIAKKEIDAYDEHIKVEVSIGVALFPEDSTAAQQLIDRADQALYHAKQGGRNRVEFF